MNGTMCTAEGAGPPRPGGWDQFLQRCSESYSHCASGCRTPGPTSVENFWLLSIFTPEIDGALVEREVGGKETHDKATQNLQRQKPGSADGRDSFECDAGLEPEDWDSDSESIRVNIRERHGDGNTNTYWCDGLIYKERIEHVMHYLRTRGAASGDALLFVK